jgi:hypothetical protein
MFKHVGRKNNLIFKEDKLQEFQNMNLDKPGVGVDFGFNSTYPKKIKLKLKVYIIRILNL